MTSTCIEDTTVFVPDGIPSFPGCEISLSLIYCFDDFGNIKYLQQVISELISHMPGTSRFNKRSPGKR